MQKKKRARPLQPLSLHRDARAMSTTTDAEATARRLNRVREALLDAVSELHGDARAVLGCVVDAQRLVRANHRTGGADVDCRIASALFHALRSAEIGRGDDGDDGRVTCASPMGLERRFTATELARETVARVPNALAAKHLADLRVAEGESGTIYACTIERYAELRDAGCAMCDKCGKFISGGERGLWWHRKTKHEDLHSEAMEAVDRERNALIALSTVSSQSNLSGQDSAYVDNKAKKLMREDDLKAGVDAARRGDGAVLDALIAARRVKALPLPGLEAARRGELAKLEALVADGWDPSAKGSVDQHGSNALLWAAGGGHTECVQFLVERAGMDPQRAVQSGRRSYAGRSALHWAARNGHANVVRYLLTRDVDVNSKTEDGSTAFAWACWKGHLDVMRYLVDSARCDYQSCNAYGCNVACWTAMGCGTVECCDYLRSLGVPFNLVNANGHSTLHKAAQRGNQEICEWLLTHGDLTSRHVQPDQEGYTPSALAKVEGFAELAEWLAKRQAHVAPDDASDRC